MSRDRVRETTSTTGTGTITLDGAVTGYQSFADGVGDGNECDYCIALRGGDEWEVVHGVVGGGGITITRTNPPRSSSNSGSPVSFSAGTKDVFVVTPDGGHIAVGTTPDYDPTSAGPGVIAAVLYQAPTDGAALTAAARVAGILNFFNYEGVDDDVSNYIYGSATYVYPLSGPIAHAIFGIKGHSVGATYDGTGACDSITGTESFATISGGGQGVFSGSAVIGVQGAAQAAGGATVITSLIGGDFYASFSGATVTNLVGVRVPLINGAATNNYGLKIGPINSATNNYAIFTETGLNHFGFAIEMPEQSDPSAPPANTGRIYMKDVGGKTAFVARFPSGAVQQIAIEP